MTAWIRNPSLIKGWAIARIPQQSAVQWHYWGRVIARRLEPEVALVPRLVTPELGAVDVGANYGVYTCAMIKAGAKVNAFEPLEECAKALRIYAAHQRGRLTLHQTALSDHSGSATLHLPHDESRALTGLATLSEVAVAHEDRTVELRTLDSFELNGVRLIKIDVEGHEGSVIRGAEKTLISNNLPSLLVEIEQERVAHPISETFSLICNFGYEGWFLRGQRLTPLADFRLERDQPPGHPLIHNFIFVKPAERWRLSL